MLLMAPNEARERLGSGVFLTPCENNPGGRIDSYLAAAVAAETGRARKDVYRMALAMQEGE